MHLVSSTLIGRRLRSIPRTNFNHPTVVATPWLRTCLFSNISDDKSQVKSPIVDENKHIKRYRLHGLGRRSRVEISTDTSHKLITDVPKKMGGSDAAPQPVETLMAAWMGCTQATALFVGRQMTPRIIIDSIEFEDIEAVRDERGALTLPIEEIPDIPSRLQKISGTIKISTRNNEPMTQDQLGLLREQTEIRCPVANMMIASGCIMDLKWLDTTFEAWK